jgi:hypothetical protein
MQFIAAFARSTVTRLRYRDGGAAEHLHLEKKNN